MAFAGKDPLRAPISLALDNRGISPSTAVSLVAALRVEKQLESAEAYLVAISVVEEEEDKELEVGDIPVVCEYGDVFTALTELPPPRKNPFTINLESGTAPIARAPYRMAPACFYFVLACYSF
ncbi:unnamed protein product [Microthlaspi erraticum]|uniref:Reverse transcriptase domain-containing protein n=1 Tax=Microthlaspi erraticum TaxID=1685480 RepID=A0A6D2IUT8_9BRAS|nr:unnamed protein product [Microthlaspi erraticum]